jgi:hypothetical protein
MDQGRGMEEIAGIDQWYVKRAEAFPRSAPRRLSERAPGDVEAFFRSFGRKPGLKDWQFRQIFDATRTLMEVARVPWRGEVDWDYWRDSARFGANLGEGSPDRCPFRGPAASDRICDAG